MIAMSHTNSHRFNARWIGFAILSLLCSAGSLHAGAPWPGVPFTEVRAYAWPDDHTTEAVILPGKTLKPGVINKEGALLTADEVKQLIAAVSGSHPKHAVAA